MIPVIPPTLSVPRALTTPSVSHNTWQQELLNSYTSPEELFQAGLIKSENLDEFKRIGNHFKIRLTPYYASLITPSKDCPIRKQAIPDPLEIDPQLPDWAIQESQRIYGRPSPWHPDAIGDLKNLSTSRITHRYENRAILHLSSMCSVYCRFCFRKSHLNDDERTLYEGSLEPALQYIARTPDLREIILTGGDPLSVSDAMLKALFEKIQAIPNIRTVRIHTRMAVTLPQRFTESLVQVLEQDWGFHRVIVSHFNHPAELTLQAKGAIRRLRRAGITLLNQSVLLKGVNSNQDCLIKLFQGLYEEGILPFYLHHPDWTPGTFHFRLSIEEGQRIFQSLRGSLSGPALPDYILDIPQGFGKISLLGPGVRKIRDLPRQCDSGSSKPGIHGAVYEITSPITRNQGPTQHLYLDLSYRT